MSIRVPPLRVPSLRAVCLFPASHTAHAKLRFVMFRVRDGFGWGNALTPCSRSLALQFPVKGQIKQIALNKRRSFMGLDNVIKIAVSLTIAAALTGHLPAITRAVQMAQVRLLQQSQASKWGSPDLLYSRHH